jgi:hypothetical protein
LPSSFDRSVKPGASQEVIHARCVRTPDVRRTDGGSVTGPRSGRDGSAHDDAPLADLAESVADRRDRADREPFEARFEERSIGASALESVWEAPSEEAGAAVDAEAIDGRGRTTVVSKRTFCERCQYLSSPPGVRCTHEGSEILEFVDKDHVRVQACPVVRERGAATTEPDE